MLTTQTILHGHCLKKLKDFPDNHFDSCVTDPPYGLSFMNKHWDYDVPAVEIWHEVLRVLKPGAHILVACGTRTQHRMAVNIEDAGFEIRDVITWHYGSGFPKSMDISKAIDKDNRKINHSLSQLQDELNKRRLEKGLTLKQINVLFGVPENSGCAAHKFCDKKQPQLPTREQMKILERVLGLKLDELWEVYDEVEREIVGTGKAGLTKGTIANFAGKSEFDITAPATDAAKQWAGWGTALKPATEFWTLARKPLSEPTIAQNVLKHGTGGLNIDGSRISFTNDADKNSAVWGRGTDILGGNYVGGIHGSGKTNIEPNPTGRWPANLILSHHPDCVCIGSKKVKAISGGSGNKSMGAMGKNGIYGEYALDRHGANAGGVGDEDGLETVEAWQCVDGCPIKEMDKQAPAAGAFAPVKSGQNGDSKGIDGDYAQKGDDGASFHDGQLGGASRFFYCAKADKYERDKGLKNEGKYMDEERKPGSVGGTNPRNRGSEGLRKNFHPTVKPIDLMRYLVKLITPKYGHVLDPFNGSGTTGIAAKQELMNYTGIEMEEEYCKISEARIAAWNPERYIEQTLF